MLQSSFISFSLLASLQFYPLLLINWKKSDKCVERVFVQRILIKWRGECSSVFNYSALSCSRQGQCFILCGRSGSAKERKECCVVFVHFLPICETDAPANQPPARALSLMPKFLTASAQVNYEYPFSKKYSIAIGTSSHHFLL